LAQNSYNLLILDWQLPQASGLDLCTEVRAAGVNTPVLFLTGMDSVVNKMAGLDSGADDYLTKPFAIPEVLARVRALLRRPQNLQYKPLIVGDLELDQRNKTVKFKGELVKLHPQEFTVLELLMNNPGRVFSGEELLSRAWPTDSDATNEAVRSVILRIRKAIDTDSDNPLITTIKGFGYRLG
ncbi:MAG: two-component system, OmpR family, manganese sensing response regulator, partial [Cyanobacteriota bacterium erpe_2018_sw_21hr_WHONDRS-SW48-000092_B_bin.40]|nr:two-component system, OmpR family, manganese sensing response regulator [Cyanobacteriota bacterium erpe_2018_sw_21hr_WHONDRS-SW48-000092_B_bin.40]